MRFPSRIIFNYTSIAAALILCFFFLKDKWFQSSDAEQVKNSVKESQAELLKKSKKIPDFSSTPDARIGEEEISTDKYERIDFQDVFSGSELRLIKYDGPMASVVDEFNLSEYLDGPISPEAAFNLYKTWYQCEKGFDLISPDTCKALKKNSDSLPSEYESLWTAAEGGHVSAQLKFSYSAPPDFESFNQEEIDSFRKLRIKYLENAWAAGSVEALQELSSAYFYGEGVDKDLVQAYFYVKTTQLIYDAYRESIPSVYVENSEKMVGYLEAVLQPYQKIQILKEAYSQGNNNCCTLFSR